MAIAWNLLTIAAAAAIVWLAMQWMARRATPASVDRRSITRNVSGDPQSLAMYTPPQHDPCAECEGVGGVGSLTGVRLCPMCDGTGIRVFS